MIRQMETTASNVIGVKILEKCKADETYGSTCVLQLHASIAYDASLPSPDLQHDQAVLLCKLPFNTQKSYVLHKPPPPLPHPPSTPQLLLQARPPLVPGAALLSCVSSNAPAFASIGMIESPRSQDLLSLILRGLTNGLLQPRDCCKLRGRLGRQPFVFLNAERKCPPLKQAEEVSTSFPIFSSERKSPITLT